MEISEFPKAQKFKLDEMIDYQSGAVVSKIIIKKDTGNLTLFAFDKGQQLSEHTVPFDAVIQIVEGTAEIIIGKKANTVKQGETIVMPANIAHEVKAIEKFKMLLTMIKSLHT